MFPEGSEIAKYMEESHKVYEDAVKSLPNPAPMQDFKGEKNGNFFSLSDNPC